jgi:DNA/RNA-binding domain of Phe-tRNA-synthetase-like protein
MAHPEKLILDAALVPVVRVAAVRAAPVAVRPAAPPLLAEIAATTAALAARHAGRAPGEIPELQPARDLYKAFGIDPTRTRPSSESLLRRVLQGKPFPSVLNAVDVCNLCSVAFLLPIGLYDTEKMRGPVTLRRGRPGESYAGIRKDDVNLEGRPVLADDEGPFGNPTSDSLRTSVTEATRGLWMVIFAPARYPNADMRSHAAFAQGALERHLASEVAPVAASVAFVP